MNSIPVTMFIFINSKLMYILIVMVLFNVQFNQYFIVNWRN